jgi:hypothetical protein
MRLAAVLRPRPRETRRQSIIAAYYVIHGAPSQAVNDASAAYKLLRWLKLEYYLRDVKFPKRQQCISLLFLIFIFARRFIAAQIKKIVELCSCKAFDLAIMHSIIQTIEELVMFKIMLNVLTQVY